MDLRVVITGKNKKISRDISNHLLRDKDITSTLCPMLKSALIEHALFNTPHIVIICLGGETEAESKIYDVLCDVELSGLTNIIVVANEKDKENFLNETGLAKLFILSRPVSTDVLYAKIDEVKEMADTEDFNRPSLFSEFINPHPRDGYKRKHILVVDDDPEQLYQIKEHIKEFYDVTVVASGKAAFKYLSKFRVDMILLDFIMPEMDGTKVLSELRKIPDLKDIPVVFLTGVSDKKKVLKIIVELAPEGYILKPSKKSELVAKIIDVLG